MTSDTAVRLRNRFDTDEAWDTINPVLLKGEVGFSVSEAGVVQQKCGDGLRPWSLLPWTGSAGAGQETPTAEPLLVSVGVDVRKFGAVGDGVTDDTAAFNAAAASRPDAIVVVPQGAYVITQKITTPTTWLIIGATFPCGDSTIGISDTTRLGGEIIHIESGTHYATVRVGDARPWLEQTVRRFSESSAAFAAKSGKGNVGVLGASRTSDDEPWTMSAIGLYGIAVNDNAVNAEPAWAQYLEGRRGPGTGALYGTEIDMVNTGNTVDVTPNSEHDIHDGQSINILLTNGGGDAALNGNNVSAAVVISGGPVSKFRRGIIVLANTLDQALNEAVTLPVDSKIAWYKDGTVVSGISGGQKAIEPVGSGVSLGSAANQWETVYAKKVIISEGGGITAGVPYPPATGDIYGMKDDEWVVANNWTRGMIVLWSGAIADVPAGWALCNGSNGTPDLRDRFAIGAGGAHNPGITGGAETHGHTTTVQVGATTLTTAQMPSHAHENTTGGYANLNNNGAYTVASASVGSGRHPTTAAGNNGSHTHTTTVGVSPSSSLPPYLALAYIMKL